MTQRTIPKILRSTACAVVLLLAAQAIHAQIGGNVDLTWHILSSGGTSASTGDTVTVGGSLGQFGPGSSSGGGVALVGGFWNPASSAPLAVTLAGFSAVQQGDSVLLTWETASELNNRGFNLYRGVDPSGPDRQLNAALIPSQSQGSPAGFVYTWQDEADLAAGQTYWYWLEDVSLNGVATQHGPVSVDYVGPTAVTLASVSASPATAPDGLAWLWVAGSAGVALGLSRLRHRR